MTNKPTPRIIETAAPDDEPVVKVEMTNRPDAFAIIGRRDHEALLAAGWSNRWFLNTNGRGNEYVRVSERDHLGHLETVARLIMKPPRGCVVGYHDGDRRNLRRENLYLKLGFAPGRTPDIFDEGF